MLCTREVVDKTRNMEHSVTFRNIPEHRIIMIQLWEKYVKLNLQNDWKDQQFRSGNAETTQMLSFYDLNFKMQLKSPLWLNDQQPVKVLNY